MDYYNINKHNPETVNKIGNTYKLFYKEGDLIPAIDDVLEIKCIDKEGKVIGLLLTQVQSIVKHKIDKTNVKTVHDKGFVDDLNTPLLSRHYGYLITSVCIDIVDFNNLKEDLIN